MVYCLIKDSDLHNNIKINCSLINDSEELKVNKTFNIELSDNNISYFTFS